MDKTRHSKVTVKIPRPLYEKIQLFIEQSGFNSPTDFIVFVLRDLLAEREARAPEGGSASSELTPDELRAVKRKLKNLGYL
ncbi:MAG: ribbon-helix-helix domain-containing protein [Planctomycetota bacterium]